MCVKNRWVFLRKASTEPFVLDYDGSWPRGGAGDAAFGRRRLVPFWCRSWQFLFCCLTGWDHVKAIKIWNWVTCSTQIIQAQPFWKRYCYGYNVRISHIRPFSEAVTVWECWEETRTLQWLHLFPVLAVLLLQSTSVTALNKASKQPSWGKMGRGSKWRILMKLFWITTRVWRVFHFFSWCFDREIMHRCLTSMSIGHALWFIKYCFIFHF